MFELIVFIFSSATSHRKPLDIYLKIKLFLTCAFKTPKFYENSNAILGEQSVVEHDRTLKRANPVLNIVVLISIVNTTACEYNGLWRIKVVENYDFLASISILVSSGEYCANWRDVTAP